MWTAFVTAWMATAGPDPTHWLHQADFPALEVQTLAGEPTPTPWTERDAVVVLWAGWCGPCVAELPLLATAMERAGSDRLPVILVSTDDRPAVAQKALRRVVRKAPSWSSVWAGPSAAGQLGARTLPTTYIVSKNGTVRSVWTGHQDLSAWARILLPPAQPGLPTAEPAK